MAAVELVSAEAVLTPFLELDAVGVTSQLSGSSEIVGSVADALPRMLDADELADP